jgi:2-amino-4-hydroxy-6-hydroxymethyldihydropteridine diphosphokinase
LDDEAILIGIGANLTSPRFGAPLQTCTAAVAALGRAGIAVRRVSAWYESAPLPASDQPRYVNGVVLVETGLAPADLLAHLHDIEAAFGRVRRARNEARVLDLDLLAYGRRIAAAPARPTLPHPRLAERAFVLLPLSEVAPGWRDPVDGGPVAEMIAALVPGQDIRRLDMGTV